MKTVTGLDVVVVGGGIVGVCAAYFLQKAGMNVTVIERGGLGGVGSGVSCAHLELGLRSSDESVELSGLGLSLMESMLSDLGNQFDYAKTPAVTYCFDERGYRFLADLVRVRGEQGWNMTLLPGEEARAQFPLLPEGVLGAAICKSAATIDIDGLVQALTTAIGDRGGRVFEHVEVLGLVMMNGRVSGVSTSIGQFSADEVVIAAGVQTPTLIQSLCSGMRVRPGEIMNWTSRASAASGASILKGPDSFAHLLPTGQFDGLDGSEEPPVNIRLDSIVHGSNGAVSYCGIGRHGLDNLESPQLAQAAQQLPSSGGAISRHLVVPTTPDALPYLGRPNGMEGLIVAVGHSSNNAAALALGKLVAQIASDAVGSLDIGRFKPERHTRADISA